MNGRCSTGLRNDSPIGDFINVVKFLLLLLLPLHLEFLLLIFFTPTSADISSGYRGYGIKHRHHVCHCRCFGFQRGECTLPYNKYCHCIGCTLLTFWKILSLLQQLVLVFEQNACKQFVIAQTQHLGHQRSQRTLKCVPVGRKRAGVLFTLVGFTRRTTSSVILAPLSTSSNAKLTRTLLLNRSFC